MAAGWGWRQWPGGGMAAIAAGFAGGLRWSGQQKEKGGRRYSRSPTAGKGRGRITAGREEEKERPGVLCREIMQWLRAKGGSAVAASCRGAGSGRCCAGRLEAERRREEEEGAAAGATVPRHWPVGTRSRVAG